LPVDISDRFHGKSLVELVGAPLTAAVEAHLRKVGPGPLHVPCDNVIPADPPSTERGD